ncbi:MAG: malto-oligosyltrehalose synthase, partial [Calditrichia bacterium]
MMIPRATYRLQFYSGFTFADAEKILDYLQLLGISHIYASPIFKARKGSTHGYDVVDPNAINPEVGSLKDFERLSQSAASRKLGWIQDIVPNHMAYNGQNFMLMDILENGPASAYYHFFDIEWHPVQEDLQGRILAPFLGKFSGESLEAGEIRLIYGEDCFKISYYELKFPLRMESYTDVITLRMERLQELLGRHHPDFIKFLGISFVLKNLPTGRKKAERREQIRFVKNLLWELYTGNAAIHQFMDENIAHFNGQVGQPQSFDRLDKLLQEQYFRLAFWKVGTEEINYRRFFTVNELISVRIDDPLVFRRNHNLLMRLVNKNLIQGIRIDHVDGLYAPGRYLERLRHRTPQAYIIVEKILELEEELPACWPVQGTTGYEFMNFVNGVFCKTENKTAFNKIYRNLTGWRGSYAHLVHEKKRLIIGKHLAGDVDNLARLLKKISNRYRYANDFTLYGLRRGLVELLSWFPVYRTYQGENSCREADNDYIREASDKACSEMPDFTNEVRFIQNVLELQLPENFAKDEKKEWLHFVKRFQQLTGPLTAKGVEDTVFYIYNRLVSLNEVGGNPDAFGISLIKFHLFSKKKAANWPLALNASATHDTKRGEDVRARLNVLSE